VPFGETNIYSRHHIAKDVITKEILNPTFMFLWKTMNLDTKLTHKLGGGFKHCIMGFRKKKIKHQNEVPNH
jgi:hypothetical protein